MDSSRTYRFDRRSKRPRRHGRQGVVLITRLFILLLPAALSQGCTAPSTDTDAARNFAAEVGPTVVTFPATDGGVVEADDYPGGDAAILLVHGARFTKESWTDQARELSRIGFRVLAINLRGRGNSTGPDAAAPDAWTGRHDVLGAALYLRSTGSRSVIAVGGSMGGYAVAASAAADTTAFDGIVILGAVPDANPDLLSIPKLYVMASRDISGSGPRLPPLLDHFDALPDPKELVVLDASEHAQHLFGTMHAARIMHDIETFAAAHSAPTSATGAGSGSLGTRATRFMDQYLAAIKRGDAAAIASFYAAEGATRFVNGRRRVSSRDQLEAAYGGDGWSPPHRIEWASYSVDSLSATEAIVSGTLNWFDSDTSAALAIIYSAVVDVPDGIRFEHETFATD